MPKGIYNHYKIIGKKRLDVSKRIKDDNPNYKDGKYCGENKCIECGKSISPKATRCIIHSNVGKLNPNFGKIFKHNGWRGKGKYYKGIWMRSSYERAYAKYLDKNKIDWQYEPQSFNLGNMTYRPDFYLPTQNKYIEIKGWLTNSAKRKINRFREFYPHIKFSLLDKKQLQQINVL